MFVVMLLGCGEPYEPARREAPVAPEAAEQETAAEPQPSATDDTTGEAGGEVTVGSLELTAPQQWNRKQTSSQFIEAEFVLPKAEGDERDGRLTLSTAGGSLEANIERWSGQFGGTPEKESKQQREIAGLEVTVVDFAGTFNDQAGPFSPGVERAGYRMLAAIVPVDETLHFIKAYGPAKTMAKHEEAFHTFLESIRRP
jgi:hypothetical protein